jgi:peptidoglycan hydrolase-like protein with peptidoglycan-binding domain
MTRDLRPALPALILLLGAVGLGVPASSAQSKGTATKKASASNAKPSSAKASTANGSATKNPTKPSAKSSTLAKGPETKKASSASSNTPARSKASSSRMRKRTSSRSRRQPGQRAPSSDRVSEIQAALAKDGSFTGTADGKWDDETAAAMRKFQASHGLNPTGRLDALTLQKLGLGSETAGVAAPTPPPGAVSRLTSSVIVPPSPTETARRQ